LLGPVTLPTLVAVKDAKPGISSFYQEPNKVCAYLRPLVEFGESSLLKRGIERKLFKHIPIFLKATAGMRELPQVPRDAIMLNIRLCLSDVAISPFKFAWRQASVISGDEEGSFSWLHVNLMLGNLYNSVPNTVGVIDMGGASVQVVFVPEHDVLENFYPVSHGAGRRLGLYSKSYESYGHKRALERMSENLLEYHKYRHHKKKTIKHPCYPRGHTFELFGRHFEGDPSFKNCLKLSKTLFPEQAECLIPDCTFNGIYQPRLLQTPFIAISGLAKVARHLDLMSSHTEGTVSMERWFKETQRVCSTMTNSRNTPDLCALSTYIFTFLTRGLGFDLKSEQISFRVQIDGTDPTVSYGLMMHEISYMPWIMPETYETQFMATALIALVMTLAALYTRVRGL